MGASYKLWSALVLFHLAGRIFGEIQNVYRTDYYPRNFRSIGNLPYYPLSVPNGDRGSDGPYLPPENYASVINYLPPQEFPQESIGGTGRFVSVQTEIGNPPPGLECNCYNEKQVAGGSDVHVDLPREEPEGYDYPKPIKRLELPAGKHEVETLSRELPPEEPAAAITTTETPAPEENETGTAVNVESDPNRPARSSPLSRKLQTKPENGPVLVRTLPFRLEQSPKTGENHRIAARTAQYYQGDPTKLIQISPPKPEPEIYRANVRPATRPYQISPPRQQSQLYRY